MATTKTSIRLINTEKNSDAGANQILLKINMSDKKLSEALKSILEKELKTFSKLIPADVISGIERKISPQVEKIIEQSGYVKKSKFENLEKLIDDLEKRIDELEEN